MTQYNWYYLGIAEGSCSSFVDALACLLDHCPWARCPWTVYRRGVEGDTQYLRYFQAANETTSLAGVYWTSGQYLPPREGCVHGVVSIALPIVDYLGDNGPVTYCDRLQAELQRLHPSYKWTVSVGRYWEYHVFGLDPFDGIEQQKAVQTIARDLK